MISVYYKSKLNSSDKHHYRHLFIARFYQLKVHGVVGKGHLLWGHAMQQTVHGQNGLEQRVVRQGIQISQ